MTTNRGSNGSPPAGNATDSGGTVQRCSKVRSSSVTAQLPVNSVEPVTSPAWSAAHPQAVRVHRQSHRARFHQHGQRSSVVHPRRLHSCRRRCRVGESSGPRWVQASCAKCADRWTVSIRLSTFESSCIGCSVLWPREMSPHRTALAAVTRRAADAICRAEWHRRESGYRPDVATTIRSKPCAIDWPTRRYSCSAHLDVARIGACDGCGWLFLDTSRAHARRWCSMSVCGVRHKMRRYHQRQAVPAGSS